MDYLKLFTHNNFNPPNDTVTRFKNCSFFFYVESKSGRFGECIWVPIKYETIIKCQIAKKNRV